MTKESELRNSIKEKIEKGICVAFSAGIDSTFLLKIVKETAEEKKGNVWAVMLKTKLHPSGDEKEAREITKQWGIPLKIIEVDEFDCKELLQNPKHRCYLCKRYLFQKVLEFAAQQNCNYVMDGTNYDDQFVYRPGLKALEELGIISPLKEMGFTKEEIRRCAEKMGISIARKPSAPCLATRLPYGDSLDFQLLKRIEHAENEIKALGFPILRLRVHGTVLRIEIPKDSFVKFIDLKDTITEITKKYGFIYITLDLEGFRSGSMDEII